MDELSRFYLFVFGFLFIFGLFIFSRFLSKSYIALIFCASVLYQGFAEASFRNYILLLVPIWIAVDFYLRIKRVDKADGKKIDEDTTGDNSNS